MTRRLRIAGTAFSALLVPACASFQPDATSMRPITPAPGNTFKPLPGPILTPTQAAKPRIVDKFAEGRTDEAPAVAEKPAAPVAPPQPPTPTGPTVPVQVPVAPTTPTIEQTRFETPTESSRLLPPQIEPVKPAPVPEPTPDADGVIRSPLPVIKGVTAPVAEKAAPTNDEPRLTLPTPGELPPTTARPTPPPVDRAPILVPGDAPAPSPPMLPAGVIGSSVHKSNASPLVAETVGAIDPPTLPTVAEKPAPIVSPLPSNSGPALLKAVKAFQDNKPDEAVACLKEYDPATQQILLSLLPVLARVSDGKLQQMKPEEMDILLDQLTKVPNMLRPRASLQASNVRLCREVHNFAHTEAFPERHEFRPGDIVYLYMELANFSCTADPQGGYTVTLASSMEMKDASGAVVWKAEPKEVPDKVSTPPQDYYRNFRLSVPNVASGNYTLTVKTTDRPTGREVQKTVEVRVGAK
jgi:hypothetical protein